MLIISDQTFDSFAKDPATSTELLSPERKGFKDVFTIPEGKSLEVGGVSTDQVNQLASTVDIG